MLLSEITLLKKIFDALEKETGHRIINPVAVDDGSLFGGSCKSCGTNLHVATYTYGVFIDKKCIGFGFIKDNVGRLNLYVEETKAFLCKRMAAMW